MSLKLASRATVYDRYAMSRRFTAQETAINVVQGNISLLASKSEIEELKNGDKTMYSKLATVELNLNSITLAVSSSEYKDINGVLSAVTQARAAITLNSQQIELKVSKDNVVSTINQSAEAVSINANKISLNGIVTANENFKILADGSMVAKNGSFTGTVYATGGTFKGDIDINVSYTEGHGVRVLSSAHSGFAQILPGFITCGLSQTGKFNGVNISTSSLGLSPSIEISFNGVETYIDADKASFADKVKCERLVTSYIDVSSSLSARDATGYFKSMSISEHISTGTLYVSGTKNRIVSTMNYGTIAQSAYETAEPMFGDMGQGIINESGECMVFIDPKFAETVSTEYGYYVFITKCGDGDTWVNSKELDTFTVAGTPGLEFDWEIKAHQKGYEHDRLKRVDLPE